MTMPRVVAALGLVFAAGSALRDPPRRLSAQDGTLWNGTDVTVPWRMNKSTAFNFIHIPKCAGSSFLQDSGRFLRVGDTLRGNSERSFAHTLGHARDMVVLLRDPMEHVYSQFLECKYDKWGKRVTRGTKFPGRWSMNDPKKGFGDWLAHFVHAPDHATGALMMFKCYNPWNMQARYLTQTNRWSHGIVKHDDALPSLKIAVANLEKVGIVGLTEHYDASLCLLLFRSLDAANVLPRSKCSCVAFLERRSKKLGTYITHRVPVHSVTSLDADTLAMISTLVQVDMRLYEHARRLFYNEVDRVRNATGVDLLCRSPDRTTVTA